MGLGLPGLGKPQTQAENFSNWPRERVEHERRNTPVQTRRLGESDLHLTTIGLGTWAIGGGRWQWAWGPQDDADSIAAIRHGLERCDRVLV